ncbi:MAG: hypothetical protein K2X55_14830 [Burkholderiaceae bacterium]|nr:hypothetical protein [Burkholderiaceae bacterium]
MKPLCDLPSLRSFHMVLPAAALLVLAGCGNSPDPAPPPTSAVPAAPEGARQGYVSGDMVSAGNVFMNKEGKGYVVLSADGDAAASVLHVVDKSGGRRVPGGPFVSLTYERMQELPLRALSATTAAGSYSAMVGGKAAQFTVAADGVITAGASDCKVSGKIDYAAGYGGAVGLSLTVAACGTVANGGYAGIAAAPVERAPASLQLIGENGSVVVDVLAFK